MFDPHFGVRDKPLAVILTASGFAVGAGEVLIKHQLSLPAGIFKLATGNFQGRIEAVMWRRDFIGWAIAGATFHSALNVLQI